MTQAIDRTSIKRALKIAKHAHKGQMDKGGKPYIKHVKAVARMVKTRAEKTVALLHDVVEDTPMTLDDLKRAGFPPDIVAAVDAISKRKTEKYWDYIERVKANRLATIVKIADATHNAQITRIKYPRQVDIVRSERYQHTVNVLKEYIEKQRHSE